MTYCCWSNEQIAGFFNSNFLVIVLDQCDLKTMRVLCEWTNTCSDCILFFEMLMSQVFVCVKQKSSITCHSFCYFMFFYVINFYLCCDYDCLYADFFPGINSNYIHFLPQNFTILIMVLCFMHDFFSKFVQFIPNIGYLSRLHVSGFIKSMYVMVYDICVHVKILIKD